MRHYEIDDPFMDVRNILDKIKRECHFYLANKSPKTNLYSGRRFLEPDYVWYSKIHGRDHKYTYTHPAANEALSEFMAADGFKATRMNSIFATGSPTWAANFGTVVVVFPAGEYSLTFFDRDMVEPRDGDLGDNRWIKLVNPDLYNKARRGTRVADFYYEDAAKKFWTKYGEYFYQSDNVDEAVRSGSEIAIAAKGYYAIRQHFYVEHEDDILQALYGNLLR